MNKELIEQLIKLGATELVVDPDGKVTAKFRKEEVIPSITIPSIPIYPTYPIPHIEPKPYRETWIEWDMPRNYY